MPCRAVPLASCPVTWPCDGAAPCAGQICVRGVTGCSSCVCSFSQRASGLHERVQPWTRRRGASREAVFTHWLTRFGDSESMGQTAHLRRPEPCSRRHVRRLLRLDAYRRLPAEAQEVCDLVSPHPVIRCLPQPRLFVLSGPLSCILTGRSACAGCHGDGSYIRTAVSHVPFLRHGPTPPAIMRVRPAVHCRCRYLISTSLEPMFQSHQLAVLQGSATANARSLFSGGPWAPCSSWPHGRS